MNKPSPWTSEKVEKLKQLWDVEKRSATQIANELGMSRNAVIGKAHRLRLSKRQERKAPVVASYAQAIEIKRSNAVIEQGEKRLHFGSHGPGIVELKRVALRESEPVQGKTLLELEWGDCHWPVTDNQFCGESINGGHRLYCREHSACAFQNIGSRNETKWQTNSGKLRKVG